MPPDCDKKTINISMFVQLFHLVVHSTLMLFETDADMDIISHYIVVCFIELMRFKFSTASQHKVKAFKTRVRRFS